MSLTDLTIKTLKPKEKLYRKADSGGLCIEVTPVGNKLWRLRYYYNGKAQMHSIGKYPEVTLVKARELRDELKQRITEGKHLTREKQKEKLLQDRDNANTFESIAMYWMETKQKGLNEKYHRQSIDRLKQHVFPKIGKMPLNEIKIPDVVRVVEAIADRGTIETAKRMKQLISQIFRYASQRGMCEHNPAADLRDLLPQQEEKHHACINIEELPEFLRKVEALQQGMTKYATKLVMFTALRTNELIAAKWDEVDFDREEWHIPKERMKMKRSHYVPLTKQIIDLLKELQQFTGDKEYIFFSAASKHKHISNGTILMGLRRMGYSRRMTGHGFRTLASTVLNEQGYDADVIEAQLAHKDRNKIRDAYNRAQYLLKRKKMMQDYACWIEKVRGSKNDNIIKFLNKNEY